MESIGTELKAPLGKFRVVGIEPLKHVITSVDDFDKEEEAISTADDQNMKRSCGLDCVYFVYDDKGSCLRDNEDVGQSIIR